jgi:hypothetical protein
MPGHIAVKIVLTMSLSGVSWPCPGTGPPARVKRDWPTTGKDIAIPCSPRVDIRPRVPRPLIVVTEQTG